MLYFFISLISFSLPIAARATTCDEHMPLGNLCVAVLKDLRPTQFSVGQKEIEIKIAKLRAKSSADLQAYIDSHPIDLVVGPNGDLYLIDGHHFAIAAMELGLSEVKARVLRNFTHLKKDEFWDKMAEKGWVYLFHLGKGPLPTVQLPRHLNQLADDPFRSLASAVRRIEGFKKSHDHYSEFKWADFFRQLMNIGTKAEDFDRAVTTAYALARSPFAKSLPGYVGWDKSCRDALTSLQQKTLSF